MHKYIFLSFFFVVLGYYAIAQKGTVSLSGNAGTAITLTEASYYQPGLHLVGMLGYGVSAVRQDAVTMHGGYHSFINKRAANDVVKMVDIKVGYRFFPSSKVPIYLHPNAGVGFFADGTGGKPSASAGMMLGYLPKVGSGNINLFAGFNRISFSNAISLFNLGAGYQFNFGKH